jgi:uncharacterized protein YjdB
MKVITRTILIFAAIGGVISGCATKSEFKDLKERMDALESDKIQSIEGQISSIDTSIGLLDQTDDQLEGYINALKEQVLELEVDCGEEREALEAAIKALQAEDESLHKQMEELKAYVDTELNGVKDWASATFVTLEEYNKTVDVITGIQAKVDSLHSDIAEEYQAAIKEAIEKSAESMKTWVNEQLTGYYDIATMNTKLDSLKSALEKQIKEQNGEMEEQIAQNTEDIEALESELKKTAEDITDAYKEAIEDAIEENNGTITQTIQNAIDGVNTKIKGLDERVTKIDEAVTKLENRMDEVERTLKNLASITYIPTYSDNKARVHYDLGGSGYIGNNLDLDFDVYPATSADAIVAAYQKDNSALSARAVYTLTKASAGEFAYLEILNVKADDGILKVQVSTEKLDNDFFRGNLAAALVLKLTTGYNNLQSDYVGLTPVFRVESVTLDKTTVTLEPCDTVRLKATVTPANAYDQTVTWTTSDSNVATVDENGKVTADRGGTATITATTTDGNFKATCTVTVNDEDVTSKFDEAFLAALKDRGYISNTATTVMKSDTYKIQEILSLGGSMTTLKGIECLANLESLDAGDYALTSVDISQNKKLRTLSLRQCHSLKSIDVSQNKKLTYLSLKDSGFSSLDVSQNKELETLSVSGCALTSLDVSQNAKLQNIDVRFNELTSIDISKNKELTSLNVNNNKLTSLDVSPNAKLQQLDVGSNELASIDISNCQNLTKFYCEGNPGDSDSKFIVTVWKGFDITGLNFPAAGSTWSIITLEYKEK